jgi:hypothetical protein
VSEYCVLKQEQTGSPLPEIVHTEHGASFLQDCYKIELIFNAVAFVKKMLFVGFKG